MAAHGLQKAQNGRDRAHRPIQSISAKDLNFGIKRAGLDRQKDILAECESDIEESVGSMLEDVGFYFGDGQADEGLG